MDKTAVKLSGPLVQGARISAPLLRDLLNTLVVGAGRSLRLRVEGRSTASGSWPGWLDEAVRFDIVGLETGSTVINVEAPALLEALPDRFQQTDMFPTCDPEKSALAHFTESLDDALSGNTESDLYDEALVGTFESFDKILGQGVTCIEMINGRSLRVDTSALEGIRALRKSTPPAQWVRVAGRLDAIRYSDRMFTVVLDNGETARGVATEVKPDDLAKLFGQLAVVSGRAQFRPSGALRRIEAEQITLAAGDVSVWSAMPAPLLGEPDNRTLRAVQGPRTGINAILGKWPGDESDEQVDDALVSFSPPTKTLTTWMAHT